MKNAEPTIVPVILCGGSGTRLWPASRERHPKQFLSLMGDLSLLQNTLRRATRISGVKAANVVTVTLGALKDGVAQQLAEISPLAATHILSEPSARNTAAAIAFAAEYVRRTFGEDAILWVLPSDHHIGDEFALHASFQNAVAAARDGNLVTFGINPTRPDTGYGYIKAADGEGPTFKVDKFVEKPDLETAKSYLADGGYLWNSGMFVFTAGAVLKEFASLAPTILSDTVTAMAYSLSEPHADAYSRIEKQPFDKAIMEKSARVCVVPSNPAWSDIGTWESLWDIREKDQNDNAVTGRAAASNARGCLIEGREDRLIAVAGLDNIVVVDTGDAILIAQKSDGNSLKSLTEALKASGAAEAVEIRKDASSSGVKKQRTLAEPKDGISTTEITVQPGQTEAFDRRPDGLSLVTVLDGVAELSINGKEKKLNALQSAKIAGVDFFSITNKGAEPLNLLVIQKEDKETARLQSQNAIRKVA